MNAKSVNDLFKKAWAEYYDLEKEVKLFCQEKDFDPTLLKVEMSGPHVHIKHRLPPRLWTEELHDELCETFGVYLNYFRREAWKSETHKPAIITCRWSYSPDYFDKKFILEYGECVLDKDSESLCGDEK